MTPNEPITTAVLLSPGGAGGKGTWGALGSELAEEEVDGAIDSNDPNYDEANPENRDFKLKVINLDRSDEELQVGINVVVKQINNINLCTVIGTDKIGIRIAFNLVCNVLDYFKESLLHLFLYIYKDLTEVTIDFSVLLYLNSTE